MPARSTDFSGSSARTMPAEASQASPYDVQTGLCAPLPTPSHSLIRSLSVPAGVPLDEADWDVPAPNHSLKSTGLPFRSRNTCSSVDTTPWSTTNALRRVKILQSSISGRPARTTPLDGAPGGTIVVSSST